MSDIRNSSLWRLWRPILKPRSAKDWAGFLIAWTSFLGAAAQIAIPLSLYMGWIR